MAEFRSFFIGSALNLFEQTCLASFIAHGHSFTLYTYDPISVPPGVICDNAASIIPTAERDAFFAITPGRISQFSNGFRYRLLQMKGGWWVDTDVLCLSPRVPDNDIVLGWEIAGCVGTAIMKLPALHPILSAAWEFWLANRPVAIHGYTGPQLITQLVHEHNIVDRVMRFETIYPISYEDALAPFDPCRRLEVVARTDGCPFLHLWNTALSHTGMQWSIPPPRGSFLRDVVDRHLAPRERDVTDDSFTSTILSALMQMSNQNVRMRNQNEGLQTQLDAIFASRTWRAMEPARRLRRLLTRLVRQAGKRAAC
jgi:hypothetical protein